MASGKRGQILRSGVSFRRFNLSSHNWSYFSPTAPLWPNSPGEDFSPIALPEAGVQPLGNGPSAAGSWDSIFRVFFARYLCLIPSVEAVTAASFFN